MINAGMGETHVNTLLSTMNVKPVNHSVLKKREREAGLSIERVAKRSCTEAATEEKELILAEQSTVDCDIVQAACSYDMQWLKRGKGHNSSHGVGAVIGDKSKKVLDYSVRN